MNAIVNDASIDTEHEDSEDFEGQDGEHIAANREPSEREKRMSEIAKQYDELNGRRAPEQEVVTKEVVAPIEVIAKDDPLKELGYYHNPAGELVTKMKINGEEREVPASQIKAFLQKDIAGDQKLQQAYEREQAVLAYERTVREREAAMQQSFSKPQEASGDALAAAKAVFESMYDVDADEDAGAKALVEFLQRSNATVNPEQILAEAERRAARLLEQREQARAENEWKKSVEDGNRFLIEAHPEIYSDSNLFDMVNNKTARMVELKQRGDPDYAGMTPKEIIARAAEEVNEWLGNKAEKPQDGAREARKAGLKPIPRSMSNPPKPKPTEIDMSPEAVLARMRAARGAFNKF